MKNNARLREIRGFILGVIVTMLFSGTALMASPVMQELVFGVRVSVDGELMHFEEDMRPFIIAGRTFLPVRAIADAAGFEAGFDEATNTVLLTTPVPTGIRLTETFLSGDELTNAVWVRTADSVSIWNAQHADVVQYRFGSANSMDSHHGLGGNHGRLTGVFGRVDEGTNLERAAVVTFYGDGEVLATLELGEFDAPISFDIDVSGVDALRINVEAFGAFGGGVNPANFTSWAVSAYLN